MSFILDALKKSESDRQRQTGPSLFEVKVAAPRRRLPVWAVAIAVLLGINAVVVSWMLLRHPAVPAGQPAARQSAPAAGTSLAARTAAAEPSTTVPSAAAPTQAVEASGGDAVGVPPQRSIPATGATPSAASPAVASAAAATPMSASAAVPSQQPAQAESPSAGGATPSDYAPAIEPAGAASQGAGGGLPLYQQVASAPGTDLPALHLDLHVFSESPQDRFVMINMHRLQEGDSLPNGVQVDAIRPDGVVLSYRGSQFLLPRN